MLRLYLIGIVLVSALARADDGSLAILAASVGSWEGELYYLDYQSGERFGIPMRVDAEVTPDGASLIRRLTYTDPGNQVYAVNLVTLDAEAGDLVEAHFREGSAELLRYTVISVDYRSENQWRLVYEQEGSDDGRPARIRHTLERDADRMTSSKEVRFLDQTSEYFLRNGTELKRVMTQ